MIAVNENWYPIDETKSEIIIKLTPDELFELQHLIECSFRKGLVICNPIEYNALLKLGMKP